MSTEPFVIERVLNAPVSSVWKAISNKDAMKDWYFDMHNFKLEIGNKFEFTAGGPEQKYLHLCKITEIVPQQKLAYTWRYDGYEGDSMVTFELFAEPASSEGGGDKTRLKLTHEGLETFPPLKSFRKENFAAGWAEITGKMLKDFVEKE